MIKKIHNYTLDDVEETLKLKTWWAALAILPFSRRITLFLCNYTEVTPNQVTFVSFLLRLLSAYLFFQGGYLYLVIGAFIFEFAYVLDCVDGSIARLKEIQSTIGCFFDHFTDTLGITLNLIALAAGQGILYSLYPFYVIVLYNFVHYITFVANSIFSFEKLRLGEEKTESILNENMFKEKFQKISAVSDLIIRYRNIFAKRRFKAFFSPPDFEAFICFLCPIVGKIREGFIVGFYFIILILVYKILSYVYVIKTNALAKPDGGSFIA